MKLFRSKQPPQPLPQLTREEALQCVPVVNGSVVFSKTSDGEILLEYPLALRPFFLSLFRRVQKNTEYPTRKLQLDEMGSKVWQYIDGKTSVKTIIEIFAKHYGITRQEAEQSITAFLVELGKRGIIALQ